MFHGVDRARCWDRRTILATWVLSVLSVLAINPSSPASSVVEAITDRRTARETSTAANSPRANAAEGYSGDSLGSEKGANGASVLAGENARRLEGHGSPNETYWKETSVPLCCPLETRMTGNRCIATNGTFHFPPLYDSQSFALLKETPTLRDFRWFIRNPCQGDSYKLDPSEAEEDAFMFLDNGSVYKSVEKNMIDQDTYCFGIVDTQSYDVVLCFPLTESEDSGRIEVAFPAGMLLSAPFLFLTFLVYTLIPELKNMHGRTLRGYVGSLLVAYVLLAVVQIAPERSISDTACMTLAYIIHFSFLASFFWLNVMCFDIWWTFGGFRSLQGSVKQRERKKFLIYSIYAWGCASVLTGVCIIMNFVRNIPDYLIRPEFGVESCWFASTAYKATAIYFYGPMGITVFCNICLFVSTAFKIVQHKKDTNHHLKGQDSRRHDDNKQWFNLYLKLFIVMGINWSMEIISWLFNNSPKYIWYLTDLTNTLQGVIIFLIFVWKDKIWRLLLKRFGCHGRDILSGNSTRSAYHSSTSRTFTTSMAPLQEKVKTYTGEPARNSKPAATRNDSI